MADANDVELGDIVRDTITGFKGVAIGITKWLHGCRRITVQPEGMKDGKPMEPSTFDEPQVEILKRAKHPTTAKTGGPGRVAARRADVSR